MSNLQTRNLDNMPVRTGEKPATNPVPPHLQYDQHSPRDIYKSLADWMFGSFPKSREHETLISVPSSRAMWLHESVKPTPPEGFMPPAHSREFAHLHKDGSIHVCLPDEDVEAVLKAKWGEVHPYKHMGVNEILVYAPQNEEEMKVMQDVIIASYEFVTGEVYSPQGA
ncbi:MAG: luciferase family protein [Oleispira sp.]